VLICKEHTTEIQNINVHLRNQHNVANKERKVIIEHCSRWQIAAPQDVELPAPMLFYEIAQTAEQRSE
jgi:hypothetical protein